MDVIVSCDVETNGPIPGPYSMLQLGAAAFDTDGKLLDTFTSNLEELDGGEQHPETMKWWARYQELYEETRVDLESPDTAMRRFHAWLESFNARVVFVGYPVAWDFAFVYWYLIRFVGDSPFSHSALDIKTLAMVSMNCPYRDATKRNMPAEWKSQEAKHTHVAVEDAVEQGHLYFAIMRDLESG